MPISSQAHFEGDQFTKTKKGQLKLKADAVPSIFLHRPEPKRRKGPSERTTKKLPVHVYSVASDHTYCHMMNFGMNNVNLE